MQEETQKVIEKKFRRSLRAHKERHKGDLKNLFKQFGIPYNKETICAYLLGVLRAICFDSVAFVEIRGARWEECPKEKAKKMKDEIIKTAEEMERLEGGLG